MNRRRLIIVGVLTLALGMVTLFPARIAYQWFSPPGIALAGIDGSVWRGSAAEGAFGGVYVRNVEWRMRPLSLFAAQLAYALRADTGSGHGCRAASADGSVAVAGVGHFVRREGEPGGVGWFADLDAGELAADARGLAALPLDVIAANGAELSDRTASVD